MTTRMRSMKKACMRLSLGGSIMAFGLFGGLGSCMSNAALTGLYTDVGTGAIDTAADTLSATASPQATNIVIEPVAGFFRNLWATFVDLHIPTDPTFENLLVN
jgi:hypothetical protein